MDITACAESEWLYLALADLNRSRKPLISQCQQCDKEKRIREYKREPYCASLVSYRPSGNFRIFSRSFLLQISFRNDHFPQW